MSWTDDVAPLRRWLTGWPDAPWSMTGRTVTLWFETPQDRARELLGPKLCDLDLTRPSRLRFYDVQFASLSDDSWQSSPVAGRFREAVVAFPAMSEGVAGEVSAFMWTDDETYLTWGRELFGWPLRLSEVTLTGPLWDGGREQGEAIMRSTQGTATLTVVGPVDAPAALPSAPPVWLTPRRAVDLAAGGDERVDITAVVPQIVRPGIRTAVEAHGELTFADDHPLHGLSLRPIHAEVHQEFELRVGADVSVVTTWAR